MPILAPRDGLEATSASAALRRYVAEARTQLLATWAYWVPLHLVNFGLVPPHLRVGFVSLAATGYVALLSLTTEALDTRSTKKQA